MRKRRFDEEQIVRLLKEAEAGAKVSELCRKHNICDATFYAWRRKYGGLEVSDAKKLRSLEDENRRLKKLLATTGSEWHAAGGAAKACRKVSASGKPDALCDASQRRLEGQSQASRASLP